MDGSPDSRKDLLPAGPMDASPGAGHRGSFQGLLPGVWSEQEGFAQGCIGAPVNFQAIRVGRLLGRGAYGEVSHPSRGGPSVAATPLSAPFLSPDAWE